MPGIAYTPYEIAYGTSRAAEQVSRRAGEQGACWRELVVMPVAAASPALASQAPRWLASPWVSQNTMLVTETDSLAGTTAVGQQGARPEAGHAGRRPGEAPWRGRAGRRLGEAGQDAGEAKRGEACKRVQRVTPCTMRCYSG